MIRKASIFLVIVWLLWFGVVVPCRVLAVDLPFWRAGFIREEMVALLLLVAGTVSGLLAWGWSLKKTGICRGARNP
jgi:hypothetical protein